MDIVKTIEALNAAGAWGYIFLTFAMLILSLPVSILLSLMGIKVIFRGTGASINLWAKDFLTEFRKRIETDTKIEEKLTDIGAQFEKIIDGLFDNRNLLDSRLEKYGSKIDKLIEKIDVLVQIIPKRKTDQ